MKPTPTHTTLPQDPSKTPPIAHKTSSHKGIVIAICISVVVLAVVIGGVLYARHLIGKKPTVEYSPLRVEEEEQGTL
jgi:hypothetical protein